MNTKTTWNEGISKKDYPKFSGEGQADAVIVGGGITGIVAAYLLAKEGKSVMLLEKETLCSGVTSYTTAFITQSLDTDPSDLIKAFGKKDAEEIFASHGVAADLIEEIIKDQGIDCDFERCTNYVYANEEKDFASLEQEGKDFQSLGLKTKTSKDGSSLGFKNAGYLAIENQAKFHPLKFALALAEKAEKLGAQIFEHSEVKNMESVGEGIEKITTESGSVVASHVLIATYKPFDNPMSLYFKKGTYVSYVMELGMKGVKLQEGVYEDTENPYHYLRIDKEDDGYRVVIGGEDHRKDVPVNDIQNYNALIEYAETLFPKDSYTLRKKWIGDMLEPIDGLPSIGQIDERPLFYTLAFSGNGMTHGIMSAMMFCDWVNGKKNPWTHLYEPSRKMDFTALMIKGKDYAEELLNGALKNTLTESPKPKF